MPHSLPLTLPPIIGHRGACGYAPENTLASLQKAAELGARWIEFDVMLTQEGEAIVFHDETLNRTTNGQGWVARSTYQEIALLDAGEWFSPQFAGEKVPTFAAYLKSAAQFNLGINVEIKPTEGKERETAEKVVELLHHYWPNTAPLPLISSFSVAALATARALNRGLCLGLLLDHWSSSWKESVSALDGISVHIQHALLSADRVQEIKRGVPYVLAYTVNSAKRATELFEMGVDAVFSDVPDLLLPSLIL
jgi:glycerophosphoryl diester phosphodiesterase